METNRWQTSIGGVGGARKKTWSDPTLKTSSNFKILYVNKNCSENMGWSPLVNFLYFLGSLSFAFFCVQSPRGQLVKQMVFQSPSHFLHPHTHPHTNQPSHLSTTERFPSSRQWMAQAPNLAFQFNKWFWTSFGVWLTRVNLEVYALTSSPFLLLKQRFMAGGRQKKRRLTGLVKPSVIQTAGTQGYVPLTSLCSEAEQGEPVRRKTWFPSSSCA